MARSFFSVELCFSFTDANAVHDEARRILNRTNDHVAPGAKWANHRAMADVLLQNIDKASRGCWEYMDDDSDDVMWKDWLLPMTDRSRQPQSTGGEWFTVTMMAQAKKGSPSDDVLAHAFRGVGDELWTRGTFASMLKSIPAISFGSIVKDALYVMPRDSKHGFNDDELQLERMKYLRVLG
ncbi:MAG TPA: hypothetical protein VGF99_20155 [Myxococcota bacterium]